MTGGLGANVRKSISGKQGFYLGGVLAEKFYKVERG